MTSADADALANATWESAIGFLTTDIGGYPADKINSLIRRHPRPADGGLTCWSCSQRGAPWPCPPILLAREAAWRLRMTIPRPREASE